LLALLSFAVLVGALKRKEKVKFKFNRQVVFNIGRFLAIFLAYILLTQPLGFIIATALFSIAAILVLGGNKRQSFIYSVPISLVTYFLFSYVLKVPLPKGILPFI
jgi:putative tricarboxylic transport membrane protein